MPVPITSTHDVSGMPIVSEVTKRFCRVNPLSRRGLGAASAGRVRGVRVRAQEVGRPRRSKRGLAGRHLCAGLRSDPRRWPAATVARPAKSPPGRAPWRATSLTPRSRRGRRAAARGRVAPGRMSLIADIGALAVPPARLRSASRRAPGAHRRSPAAIENRQGAALDVAGIRRMALGRERTGVVLSDPWISSRAESPPARR
jgi:hypothetical protein